MIGWLVAWKCLVACLFFDWSRASDMPAFKADAQVYPGVADFQAILAPISARCDLTYLVKMTTLFCHALAFLSLYDTHVLVCHEDVDSLLEMASWKRELKVPFPT